MVNHHNNQFQERIIWFVFLLKFLCLPLVSQSYTPSCQYFINCGSDSPVTVDNRVFVGDKNSNPSSFWIDKAPELATNNNSSSVLYRTAWVFRRTTAYKFNNISVSGSFLIRLHFYPFTSLSDAKFNVSTPNFTLLSNFGVQNRSDFPVIEEFYLNIINATKFSIYFLPVGNNSFGFVNAIEVFSLPEQFILVHAGTVPPVPSTNGSLSGDALSSKALRKLHRINVGGSGVNDSLWRNWLPDDSSNQSVVLTGSSILCPVFNGKLNYDIKIDGYSRINEAGPDDMYKTCREVNGTGFLNSTWRFEVKGNSRCYLRVHFCNVVSDNFNGVFNLFLNSGFEKEINPRDQQTATAIPFLWDFVVDPDSSGYLNVGIGTKNDPTLNAAYLNGVEIFELVEKTNLTGLDSNSPSTNLPLIIGVTVGGFLLLMLIVAVVVFVLKLRKAKAVKALGLTTEPPYGRGKSLSWKTEKTGGASPLPNLNLKLKMPFTEVLKATNNFDPKLLIGEGGFGKVYKGTLGNGLKVAVKRSHSSHGQGLPEFRTEVTVLSKIRHRHLLSLIGYCDAGSEMILIYDYMEKGTLRDHLYTWKENTESSSTKSELTWKQRLEICIGSARGLHYLHTGSEGGIIHRDVKSTNILLDENFVAKVADFGLSQTGASDSENYSTSVKGSFGYLDPEFFKTLQLTVKSDVYSFGVVLLEVLCARLPIINSSQREEKNLVDWGMLWHRKGQLEKIIDPLLVGQINPNSLRKFGEIIERCLKPEGADRPTMLDVSWDLEYALQLQQTAVHREPYEDSTMDVSSNLVFPAVQRMQSSSFIINDDDDPPSVVDDSSDLTASEVFSQLKIDGAR